MISNDLSHLVIITPPYTALQTSNLQKADSILPMSKEMIGHNPNMTPQGSPPLESASAGGNVSSIVCVGRQIEKIKS